MKWDFKMVVLIVERS